jgi:hypothetical protein
MKVIFNRKNIFFVYYIENMGRQKSCNRHSESSSDSDSSSYNERYSNSEKRRRRHHRSSSCSSESSTEKKINHKVNHVEKHLEKKDRELERKDRHFARRIKRLERKYCRIYNKIKWNLRREKCLMVNGCDAYCAISSFNSQSIPQQGLILFESIDGLLNIDLVNNGTQILFKRSGVYNFDFTGQFDQPCQLAVFQNGIHLQETTTASNSGAHIVTLHQLLFIESGDVIDFRNHTSTVTLTTSVPASGLEFPSQNIDLTIFKLAPLPEPCCVPPPICEEIVWTSECCSESEYKHHEKPEVKQETKVENKESRPVKKEGILDSKFDNKTETKNDTKVDKLPFVVPKQTVQQTNKNTSKYNKIN